jgi:hypothetical protein
MATSEPAPRDRPKDSERRSGAASRHAAESPDVQDQDLTRTALPAHVDRGSGDRPGVDQRDSEARRRRIEFQAYMLYLRRGGVPGADLDDWLTAERQIDGQAD